MRSLGDALQSMLEARAERGAAITSLVLQTRESKWDLGSESFPGKDETLLADRLRGCVEHLEIISPDKPIPLADPIRDIWRVEGEEMYWTLDDYHKIPQDGSDG